MKTLNFSYQDDDMVRSLTIEPEHTADGQKEPNFRIILSNCIPGEDEELHTFLLDSRMYARLISEISVGENGKCMSIGNDEVGYMEVQVTTCKQNNERNVSLSMEFVSDDGILHFLLFKFDISELAKFNILAEPHYVESLLH